MKKNLIALICALALAFGLVGIIGFMYEEP